MEHTHIADDFYNIYCLHLKQVYTLTDVSGLRPELSKKVNNIIK